MKNVRRRSDRIRSEEQFDVGFLRCGDEAKSKRGVAADVAIEAGFELRGRDVVGDLKRFRSVAVAVAGFHCEQVGLHEDRLVLEFVVQPALGGFHGAVVEPVAHAEGKKVFASVHALGVKTEILQRRASELGQLDFEQAIAVECVIVERVLGLIGFAQIGFKEVVDVDDENAVWFQVREIHFQSGGIHRDQRVDCIAGRIHIGRRKMNLESANARERTRRSADFSGEVRERRKIIAEKGSRISELAAGDLHSVTRVAAETDDRVFHGLAPALQGFSSRRSHSRSKPQVKLAQCHGYIERCADCLAGCGRIRGQSKRQGQAARLNIRRSVRRYEPSDAQRHDKFRRANGRHFCQVRGQSSCIFFCRLA